MPPGRGIGTSGPGTQIRIGRRAHARNAENLNDAAGGPGRSQPVADDDVTV